MNRRLVPIVHLPQSEQRISSYSRLSASQIGRWNACPRIWWYEARMKIKSPLPPVIARGNAVEECVCRVLRETPVLIEADAVGRILTSPLDEDGFPTLDSPDGWPGPTIEPLPRGQWPSSAEALSEWAHSRIDAHFQECWDGAVAEWRSLTNTVGDAADLEPEPASRMAHVAIDLHLQEVARCEAMNGGPRLDEWRRGGGRGEWPAPDGFPRLLDGPPIEAEPEGTVTWVEAWAIARPWFVDPDARKFTSATVHPEQWFQGEYDLIHRWDGDVRIVDLKASVGDNDRSASYVDQLRIYAWLWWSTHQRAEAVSGLEIWYLGAPDAGGDARKVVDAPTIPDMEEMDRRFQAMHDRLYSEELTESDCPPEPRGLIPFDAGGVQRGEADAPESRCQSCAHRGLCEATDHDPDLPVHEVVEHLGQPQRVSRLATLEARCTVRGRVFSIIGPSIDEAGGVDFNFELRQGMDAATVKPAWGVRPRDVWRGLAKDADVRVVDGLAKVWRGRLEIEVDDVARIERAGEPNEDEQDMIDIHPRANVVGRVWSIDSRRGVLPNGETSTRWALTIVDESGIAGVVAFRSMIPTTAPAVERGDWIGIVNGEIGEFAGRRQIRFGPGTTLLHLRDADRLTDW